jgi:hypothetical protein
LHCSSRRNSEKELRFDAFLEARFAAKPSSSCRKTAAFSSRNASKTRWKKLLDGARMNHLRVKLAIATLLCGMAYAQTPSQPAASPVVSADPPIVEIKAGKPAPADGAEGVSLVADPASLVPDMPALPHSRATLVGGTLGKLDRVRDEMTINLFGGGRMKIWFDPRTHIYLSETEGKASDLREGERVYVDTMLDGTTIFARNIRIKAQQAGGQSQGVVTEYRADRGELTLRDALSPSPVHIRLSSATRVKQGDRAVPLSALAPGCLIGVEFDSDRRSGEVAREISILAMPGVPYTFQGQVTYLNLSTGLLVLTSSTDRKSYEIYFDPSTLHEDDLQMGAVVTVVTGFDGRRYLARNLTVNSANP